MADGIAVSCPGDIPFGILSGQAERVVTVAEEACPAGCAEVIAALRAAGYTLAFA